MAGIRTGLVLLLASLTAVVFAHTALADPTAPLAHADAYSVTGSSITVDAPGVLGNDTFTAPATVALSGPGPAHGSLTLNPDGSFTYTPSVGFTGSDTFDYTVTDAVGFALAMVTLDVGPAVTPIAAAGDEYGGYRDTTLTIPASTGVLANDSGNGLLSATLVDNATHGSLLLNSDGSFAYNPDPGYTGNDSFTYTATDATPATSTPTTVTLQVHRPPTAVDDSYSTGSTSHLVVDFLGGVLINDDGLQPTAQLVSPTSHGQISLSSDGSFIYIPSGTYSGTDSFTYTISDGPFTSNTATATITVNAVAPANDNFAGAQPTGSDSGTYTGDSSFSTSEPADPYGLGKSVWFSYVPTASGQLEIDTCGTNFSNYVLVTDDAEQVLTYAYVSCSYGHLFLNVTGGTHYYFELASDTFQGGPYTINWTLHLPPSNDDAANATVLSGNSGSLDGSTARATADPTDPGYGYAMPSVWYAWTASRDGQLTVDDCGPNAGYYSEYLAVTDTSGVTLAGPQYIPCYYGALRVPVTAGQTYRIEVTGYYGNTNPFTVRWVFNAPPANDNFANAQVLSGASGSAAGTTTLATYEPTDVFFSPNVWFAYTAPSTGVAQFDTCGTGNTTVLAAYDTAHTNLVTQYGGCGAMPVPVTAGEEIRIMVASYYGNAFDFGLNYRFFGTPANDNPSTAQSLTGDTGSVTGDDTAATDSGSHYTSGGHDIFFLYNPSTDGTAIFSSRQSSFQSTLNVLDANGSGGWSSIATGDRIVTSVTAGRTYLVVLDGCCSNADGAYELDYDLGQPAASDNFAHREILPFDANGSLSGNNDYSTAEPFDITNGGQSNWYAYTPHQDGSLLLTANGSGFTPQIAVGEDDGSGGVTADGSSGNGRLVVPVLGGTTYYIAVDGSDSGGGCGECETATTQSSTLGGGITGDYTVDLSLSGPPANDHSAGAFDLGTSLSGNTSESNLGATGAGDEFTQNGSGVWFVLHPDAGTYGRLTLSTSSNTFFPQISAGHLGGSYATGFGSLQTIISGDTPIYIEIDGDPSQQGDFQLQWSFQALTPPSSGMTTVRRTWSSSASG